MFWAVFGGGAVVPGGAAPAFVSPAPCCAPWLLLVGPDTPSGPPGAAAVSGPFAGPLFTPPPALLIGPPGPTEGAVDCCCGLPCASELVTVVLDTWRDPDERRPDEEPAIGFRNKEISIC